MIELTKRHSEWKEPLYFFHLIFVKGNNKHTIFHHNKLKLQQNYINIKRYTRLRF